MNVHNHARRECYAVCVTDNEALTFLTRSIYMRIPRLPEDVQCAIQRTPALSHPWRETAAAYLAVPIPSRGSIRGANRYSTAATAATALPEPGAVPRALGRQQRHGATQVNIPDEAVREKASRVGADQ
jgi:hypothetical protein